MKNLFSELRRRGVITVMAPYTVTAWLLVQVGSILVPAFTLPPWTLTLLIIILCAGFPVALYIAWFFDWTAQGLRRTPKVSEEQLPQPLATRHWLGLSLISVAAIALSIVSFQALHQRQLLPDNAPVIEDTTLAIMVFRDLSQDQSLGYMAEGLAEELIVNLGQQTHLQLTALSSTRQFRNNTTPPDEIGRKLGVNGILEGSVRAEGSKLIVTATLLDAQSGKTRWSQKYQRQLKDLSRLQMEIARGISNALGDSVTEDKTSANATGAADAYLMYLRGRHALRERTVESIKQARKYFEQALAFDEEYAPAYVGLAQALRQLARGATSFGDMDPDIANQLARQQVENALMRDPTLAESYAVLGELEKMRGQQDIALANYNKAINLNPSFADAYIWRYLLLKQMGRYPDAVASLEKAYALDPLSTVVLINRGTVQYRAGEYDAAQRTFTDMIAQYPDSPMGYRGMAAAFYVQGRLSDSAEYWHRALLLSPQSEQYTESLANLFLEAGLAQAAASLLDPNDYAVNLAIAAGNYELALNTMRADVAAYPDEPLVKFEAAWYESMWGERERGKEMLRELDSSIEQTGYFDPVWCNPAILMAYAFDPSERRQYWLSQCEDFVQSRNYLSQHSSELQYLQARIAALKGQEQQAADALIRALELGWRSDWVLYDPILQSILPRADVQTALEQMQVALQAEKQKLTQLAVRWGYLSAP
ncbi:tetratricopeptide repeat protein [Bowmanella sp. JS7-9]|uniref:Tetratricopeptide repeat protein n=1 Tax=Pseudobowmanella zhangzhouensis TaxID=1537679 RepID=A0ABW1XLB7_9ALTE|nr:tetratricopeptide repeat protein [Bowmanella sp. JS7-9]